MSRTRFAPGALSTAKLNQALDELEGLFSGVVGAGSGNVSISGATAATAQANLTVKAPNGSNAPISFKNHAGLGASFSAAQYDALTFPIGFVFDYTRIAADEMHAAADMGGRSVVIGQAVNHNFGGPGATGARIAQAAFATMIAPTNPAAADAFMVAHWGLAQSAYNNGGTAGTARGFMAGYNPQVQLAPGATFWSVVTGGEVDVEVDAGASVAHKIGWNITTIGNDAVHGSVRDTALHIGAVASSGGWLMGVQFSDFSGGGKPIASTGTLIGSQGAVGTVAKGVDFGAFTFTGNAFASPGFAVNPFGTVTTPGLATAGTSITFNTPGGQGLRLIDQPAVANLLQVYGAALGSPPTVSVEGADANISLQLIAKGTGSILVSSPVFASGGITAAMNGITRTLQLGAADSGGAGWRTVRVTN